MLAIIKRLVGAVTANSPHDRQTHADAAKALLAEYKDKQDASASTSSTN